MNRNRGSLYERSRRVQIAVWALLLAYVALVVYQSRTGSETAAVAMDVLFGVLIFGIGANVIYRDGQERTLLTGAAALFMLGGVLHVVRNALPVLGSAADLTVLLGIALYVGHWLLNLR